MDSGEASAVRAGLMTSTGKHTSYVVSKIFLQLSVFHAKCTVNTFYFILLKIFMKNYDGMTIAVILTVLTSFVYNLNCAEKT